MAEQTDAVGVVGATEAVERPEPAATRGWRAAIRRPMATFQVKHYPAFWSGNLLQFFCFNMNITANQWLVTSLTPSRTAIGLVGFIQGGTIALTSPVSGVVVDRVAQRNLMILCRFLLGVLIAIIGTLSLTGHITLWHIWVESLFVGLIMSVSEPATQTFVFDIVGRERIQNAVALNSMGTGLSRLGGPAIAGLLIAGVGVTATFFSATAGLWVACLLFLTIPILGRAKGLAGKKSAFAELREGLAYVRGNPAVALVLFSCTAALFNGSLTAMRPIFARHVLHVGSAGFGAMSAAGGIGSLVGAFFSASLPQTRRPGIQTVLAMLFTAVCLFAYSLAFNYEYVLGVEFVNGIVSQFWQVSIFSGLQLSVPEEMRGRIIGLVFTCVQLLFVGQLMAGILADHTSDQFAMGLFGAIPAVWMLLLLILGWKTLASLHPIHEETTAA